ncbi:MAG: hemoglobin/transferrin/lactoferrin receptor protein [Planctomycetota bacterium]|jgi:hemoglobin/transferrin/lactoferrin receptor protein
MLPLGFLANRRLRQVLAPSLFLALATNIPLAQNLVSLRAQAAGETGESQNSTTNENGALNLGETIVTATITPHSELETPASIEVIDSKTLQQRSYRTLPQALRDIPGVMVQETSHGQGSPYIRGFTGFRNLLLIDGIRLNNSVFRDGPNQYWNTVDPLTLDRLDVVKGPSSVLYGSDAIGGTVNAITKDPYVFGSDRSYGGKLFYRWSSAEQSHVVRGELSAALDQTLGVLVGVTGKDFDDLKGGKDIGEQRGTGYTELDGDLKIEKYLDPDTRLVFGYQHVRLNDVPRTHRTIFAVSFEGTAVGSDLKRNLDQSRDLAYVQVHGENVDSFFDTYNLSLSYHEQSEFRDRIKSDSSRQTQGFDVGTLGLYMNFSSPNSHGRFTYGFDLYHDEVDSFSSSNAIQGPIADDSSYDLFGVFVQDEIEVNEKLDVTLGGRFNYAAADANSVLDPVSSTKFSIDDNWSSFVGSARFLYRLTQSTTNLFGGISQGFRAPNLSDLTRFDSARTDEFEIPSPGLDAEKSLTYELGIKTEQASFSSQLAFFYTSIQDQIVRFPTGNTNGSGDAEITKDNVGDGYVLGVELGAAYEVLAEWTLFGNATITRGKVETFPTSAPVIEEEYIDRLMPLTAQFGARWDNADGHTYAELVGIYADDADRLSTRDMSDGSRIPPGGTPGYVVLHARGGCRISENTTLNLGLENLTDEDYRVHGSGQNQPGLNLFASLSVSF